jgi:hypothetical protein
LSREELPFTVKFAVSVKFVVNGVPKFALVEWKPLIKPTTPAVMLI